MMETPDWVKQAKVGDFVVAIMSVDPTNQPHIKDCDPIEKGKVYEIKEIFITPQGYIDSGLVCFRMVGHNPGINIFTKDESACHWCLFKPVQTLPNFMENLEEKDLELV